MACKDLEPDGSFAKYPGAGLFIAGGLEVPADNSQGYAPSCLFHHVDGSGSTVLYVNTGTSAACTFKKVTNETELALAIGAYLPLAGGTLDDGANITVGSTTGTKIGTATTQKIGFYNAAPVAQPASANQAAANQSSDFSGSDTVNKQTVLTAVVAVENLANQLRSDLIALGLIKGSA